MATRTVTTLVDDMTGEEGENIRTRELWLDGVGYEVDLNEENSELLDASLQDFLEAGRKLKRVTTTGVRATRRTSTGTRGAGQSTGNREHNQAVRAWAKKQGYEISERGRVPGNVLEAFEVAHQPGSSPAPSQPEHETSEAQHSDEGAYGGHLTAVG